MKKDETKSPMKQNRTRVIVPITPFTVPSWARDRLRDKVAALLPTARFVRWQQWETDGTRGGSRRGRRQSHLCEVKRLGAIKPSRTGGTIQHPGNATGAVSVSRAQLPVMSDTLTANEKSSRCWHHRRGSCAISCDSSHIIKLVTRTVTPHPCVPCGRAQPLWHRQMHVSSYPLRLTAHQSQSTWRRTITGSSAGYYQSFITWAHFMFLCLQLHFSINTFQSSRWHSSVHYASLQHLRCLFYLQLGSTSVLWVRAENAQHKMY